MRLLFRILLIVISSVVLLVASLILWLLFYHRNLPDIRGLAKFAPSQPTQVADPCLTTSSYVVIPYEAIGDHLRAALRAAEASEDELTMLTAEYRGLTGRLGQGGSPLSWQISLTTFCEPSKMMSRELDEFRVAVWLDRHFSRRELLTIYANRFWFAKDVIGVESASQYFFGKHADQLSAGDAAMLAGILRAPSRFSPISHPDRALQRRNQVLDAMVAAHALTEEEATAAKASELKIIQR